MRSQSKNLVGLKAGMFQNNAGHHIYRIRHYKNLGFGSDDTDSLRKRRDNFCIFPCKIKTVLAGTARDTSRNYDDIRSGCIL